MDAPSALALRLSGLTYGEVGRALGVSRQRIQQLLAPPAPIRRIVVDRAKGLCEQCGIKAERGGHVHHKASVGLTCDHYHDLDNLALLCPACHRLVHQPTISQHLSAVLSGKKGVGTTSPAALGVERETRFRAKR